MDVTPWCNFFLLVKHTKQNGKNGKNGAQLIWSHKYTPEPFANAIGGGGPEHHTKLTKIVNQNSRKVHKFSKIFIFLKV